MSLKKGSRQVNMSIPEPALNALDDYIEEHHLDIARAAFIKYLLSAYGQEYSPDADLVYSALLDDMVPKHWLTIRSDNSSFLAHSETRVYRLISAMIYCKIPIKNYYYDGKFI